jgi:glucose uptake protein GlcU
MSALRRILVALAGAAATLWLGARAAAAIIPLGWATAVQGQVLIRDGHPVPVGLGLAALVVIGIGLVIVGTRPRPTRVQSRHRAERRALLQLTVGGVGTATLVALAATAPAALVGLVWCLVVGPGSVAAAMGLCAGARRIVGAVDAARR